ncbi:sensor histidine kinase [Nonomuraea sp. NPDC049400]|uniref:sensor histidine kinase n=1 Tax=Nonomuraea sp. NPDC049400 TaxID=3364352 RepID=UPI0037AD5849
MSASTGIAVEVWALPKGDIPDAVARNVYAAVREALANVERHSRARTVSIALTLGKSGLRLTVSDDGCGFSPGTTGRGLSAMKAYFAEMGGDLTVNGVPGGGTTVSGIVPPRALR